MLAVEVGDEEGDFEGKFVREDVVEAEFDLLTEVEVVAVLLDVEVFVVVELAVPVRDDVDVRVVVLEPVDVRDDVDDGVLNGVAFVEIVGIELIVGRWEANADRVAVDVLVAVRLAVDVNVGNTAMSINSLLK